MEEISNRSFNDSIFSYALSSTQNEDTEVIELRNKLAELELRLASLVSSVPQKPSFAAVAASNPVDQPKSNENSLQKSLENPKESPKEESVPKSQEIPKASKEIFKKDSVAKRQENTKDSKESLKKESMQETRQVSKDSKEVPKKDSTKKESKKSTKKKASLDPQALASFLAGKPIDWSNLYEFIYLKGVNMKRVSEIRKLLEDKTRKGSVKNLCWMPNNTLQVLMPTDERTKLIELIDSNGFKGLKVYTAFDLYEDAVECASLTKKDADRLVDGFNMEREMLTAEAKHFLEIHDKYLAGKLAMDEDGNVVEWDETDLLGSKEAASIFTY